MTKASAPSPTQLLILITAAKREHREIEPLPSNVTAGIKQRVLDALIKRKWAHYINDQLVISPAGFEACGFTFEPKSEQPVEEKDSAKKSTKLALMIDALSKDDGASIEQLAELTGWQRHSVRGALSNLRKKNPDLTIVGLKVEGGKCIYRIQKDAEISE